MFSKKLTKKSTSSFSDDASTFMDWIREADAVVIGAGSGLSSAAGFLYAGPRFQEHFQDFEKKYGITDMYSGGFYPFNTLEEYWAWWSRHIFINRYENPPKDTYELLYSLVKDKNYFILTTNVDHLFQKSGFDENRIFPTQGDYGLLQCVNGCHPKTYDNETLIKTMTEQQENMKIPSELIPYCPVCGSPMVPNLRVDENFVEDDNWHAAKERYLRFLSENSGKNILYLELGVGFNTPGIIKYPFWNLTSQNPSARYLTINMDPVSIPKEIQSQSHVITGDIHNIIQAAACLNEKN